MENGCSTAQSNFSPSAGHPPARAGDGPPLPAPASFNNSLTDPHEAAFRLLSSAIHGNAECQALCATIPTDAWPDPDTRAVGATIADLHTMGRPIDVCAIYIHAEELELRTDTTGGTMGEISGTSPTCDPERDARLIREAFVVPDFRRKLDVLGRIAVDGDLEGLRHAAADLGLFEHIPEQVPDSYFLALNDWRAEAAKPVPWTFDGAIPDRAVTIIGGPGGVGKTALSRALVLSAITGRALLPSFTPARIMPAVVLSGEDSAPLYLRGLMALAILHKIPRAEMDAAVGTRLHLRALQTAPFLEHDSTGAWRCGKAFGELMREVRRVRPGIVVIDTFRRFFGGDSENDNALAGEFMELCASVAQETSCAVVVLHHLRKSQDTATRHQQLRGGSAIGDESRCVWIVNRTERGLTVTNDKQNYGAARPPVDLQFTDGALVEVTEKRDPAVLVPTIVRWILENPERNVTVKGLASKAGDGGDLARHLIGHHPWFQARHVHPAIAMAMEQGLLTEVTVRDQSRHAKKVLRVPVREAAQ